MAGNRKNTLHCTPTVTPLQRIFTPRRNAMTDACIPQEIWDHQVTSIEEPPADWLWEGFIARANLTLLTSMWKSGKTTLVSLLLSRHHETPAQLLLELDADATDYLSATDQAISTCRTPMHLQNRLPRALRRLRWQSPTCRHMPAGWHLLCCLRNRVKQGHEGTAGRARS
jgi:hypothetical protein